MRLFITKQSCNMLRVAGSIPDHDALSMDECEDTESRDEILVDIEQENGLLRSIYDCDHWDGTAEELQRDFEEDMARYADPRDSTELFRAKRATLAVQHLKLYCEK